MTEYYVVSKTTGTIINCVTSDKTATSLKEKLPFDWDRYDLNSNPSQHSLMEYEFYTTRP